MLQLILGEAGTGKTTETLRRIRASAARQQPALLLVPEHASFEMERRVSALFTAEEQRYVTLYSFPRLAENIFRECGGLALRPMDEVSRALLMREAIAEVADALTLYRRQAAYPGFVTAMPCRRCSTVMLLLPRMTNRHAANRRRFQTGRSYAAGRGGAFPADRRCTGAEAAGYAAYFRCVSGAGGAALP